MPASHSSALGGLFLECRPAFTAPSFENFVVLVTGWLLCQGRHTISRVLQAAGPAARRKHHATFYRFLSRARWAPDALGQALFRLLLPLLPEEILVIGDDTLCHRNGPHLFGAGMHHDATRSTYGGGWGRRIALSFGHNWVTLALWVPVPWDPSPGWAVPVLLRLYRSPKRCPKSEYRKRTDLAREMLAVLMDWLPEERTLVVVGDSEYACRTLVRELPADVVFVGPMPLDAALYAPASPRRQRRGRPPLKGGRLPSPQTQVSSPQVPWERRRLRLYGRLVQIQVKSWVALWYRVAGTRPVRVVLTHDPSGRLKDRAFFCTDPSRSVQEILGLFARRWELEVAFRNVKQNLGAEEPQNGWWRRRHGSPRPPKRAGPQPHRSRGALAVARTVPLAFTAYAVAVAWYLRAGHHAQDVARARRLAPWYRQKRRPSFLDALAAVRRQRWSERLSATCICP